MVILVAFSVWLGLLLSENAAPPRWIRVWGATGAATPLVLRLEISRDAVGAQEVRQGYEARLLPEKGPEQSERGSFDEEGSGIATFVRGSSGPARLRVVVDGQTLVDGLLREPRFGEQLKFHSAAVKGVVTGEGRLEARILDGRLLFGREGSLELTGAPRTKLYVEAQGLEPVEPKSLEGLETDSSGVCRLRIRPQDLSVSLRAVTQQTPKAEFFAEIAVEQSQVWAGMDNGTPMIYSLSRGSMVHYALVSERGLLARGRVAVDERLALAGLTLPAQPSWLVVGLESALDGPSAIGWPLHPTRRETVTWREALLLDGRPAALKAHQRFMARRAATVMTGLAAVGALLFLTVIGFYWRARRSVPTVTDEWGRAVSLSAGSPRVGLYALLLLALGFAALGYWASVRLLSG